MADEKELGEQLPLIEGGELGEQAVVILPPGCRRGEVLEAPAPPATKTSYLIHYLTAYGIAGAPPEPLKVSEGEDWFLVEYADGGVGFHERSRQVPLLEPPKRTIVQHYPLPLVVPPARILVVEGKLNAETEAVLREFIERLQPTPPREYSTPPLATVLLDEDV